MTIKSIFHPATLLFFFAGQPVSTGLAQENQEAELVGTINGEPVTWQLRGDKLNPSAVFTTLAPDVHLIRVHAYQSSNRKGSIQLEFLLDDGEVSNARILYFPFAPLHPRFSFGDDHGRGEMIVRSFEIDALVARLSVSFDGELYYDQSPNTRPISQRVYPAEIDFRFEANRQ